MISINNLSKMLIAAALLAKSVSSFALDLNDVIYYPEQIIYDASVPCQFKGVNTLYFQAVIPTIDGMKDPTYRLVEARAIFFASDNVTDFSATYANAQGQTLKIYPTYLIKPDLKSQNWVADGDNSEYYKSFKCTHNCPLTNLPF